MTEAELWEAVADSVDARVADAMVNNAMDMATEEGWLMEGRPTRYGGMYTGALDALFAAVRRRLKTVEYAMAAEATAAAALCGAGTQDPEHDLHLGA